MEKNIDKIIPALNWRYATKKFDAKKKLSDNEVSVLLESLRLAPSSFGIQPWKFLVITNSEIRKKIMEASWNQKQVVEASHLIVITVDKHVNESLIKKYITQVAKVRKVTIDSLKGFQDMLINFRKGLTDEQAVDWAKKQAYIALGFLMESASLVGVDSCPMEGFDSKKVDEILGLDKKRLTTAVMCPVGFRASDDNYSKETKVRFDEKDVIEWIK